MTKNGFKETGANDLSSRLFFLPTLAGHEVLLVSVFGVDGFLPSVPYIMLEDEDGVEKNREQSQAKLGRIAKQ